MGRKPLIKVGDVFKIPLSNNKFAYGQFVYEDKKRGDILRVFDKQTKGAAEQLNIADIDSSKLQFPPIYASMWWAVKEHGWEVIGTLPVDDYTFKGFLYHMAVPGYYPDGGGKVKEWSLWDGEKYIDLGEKLPDKYLDYEDTGILPADLVVQRIETGFDSLEYPKKYNRYITRDELKAKYPKVKIDN
ncbi:MAG: Imm26 family immunity protein [Candidatus Levyibacteriota bacterium]